MMTKHPPRTLLDYSEYITTHAKRLIETLDGGLPDEQDSNEEAEPWNRESYRPERGVCPYCTVHIPLVHELRHGPWNREIKVWGCPDCGWWEYEEQFFGGQAEGHTGWDATNHQAIVRSFDLADAKLPLQTLLDHVTRQEDLLYGVHPTRMEEIVQHVFGAYYNCQVIHCGRSHDGGKDLILVDSDEPTLVQVKRRETPFHVESVEGIREFLGALVLHKSRKGIFVSTADHFSKISQKTVQTILSENIATRFELVDFKRFTEMLGVLRHEDTEPWRQVVDESLLAKHLADLDKEYQST